MCLGLPHGLVCSDDVSPVGGVNNMGNLVSCKMVRLYGVSKKSGRSSELKLMPLDNDAFNEDIDESEIDDTIS